MRTWAEHLQLWSACTTTCLIYLWPMRAAVIKDCGWRPGLPKGVGLAVEGWRVMCVDSTFLRRTQASPGWIYSTSLLSTPAGPLPHKNETTAFMTDWEGAEGASCRDEGVLFTRGCCQTTAKFITSSKGPLGQSHADTLMKGFAYLILK